MATIIKPPHSIVLDPELRSVFLAGTIEQGNSPDWQADFANSLREFPVTILSPRRDHWDPTWKQTIEFREFRQQVEWELDALDQADLIAMYFHPGTKSPITLLELGLYAKNEGLIVCCPDGFWRKGNVDIVCERHDIQQAPTMDALVESIKRRLVAHA